MRRLRLPRFEMKTCPKFNRHEAQIARLTEALEYIIRRIDDGDCLVKMGWAGPEYTVRKVREIAQNALDFEKTITK